MLALVTVGFLLLGKAVLWQLDAALAFLPVSAPVSVDSFLVAGSAVLGAVRPTRVRRCTSCAASIWRRPPAANHRSGCHVPRMEQQSRRIQGFFGHTRCT
jgi:hypothetical protein